MSDVMREEFEKSYTELQLSIGLASPIEHLFECEEGGEYTSSHTSIAWWAWQASRAAIEVKLPPAYKDTPPYECYENFFNAALDTCKKSIEASGLRVRP